MENASKALLIAGAILLVISIIAVGMYVFNQARAVTDQAGGQINTLEKETFNSQFTMYIGENIRGTEVRALISKIVVSNSEYPDRLVELNGLPVTGAEASTYRTTERFTVTAVYGTGANAGIIVNVVVE